MNRNCWTCRRSGPMADGCEMLTGADWPILNWLDAAPMSADGTVPHTSDGCPGWVAAEPIARTCHESSRRLRVRR